ncbi:hypothetical protein KQ233_08625 [Lacticaseibacillus rhamnosus]|nr:hypothetical protein HMPREF0541_02963 [Lacticaseibacillus rhamnosus ATCC 21052]MBU5978993.1 hypothetical protein [Lacticaseibacillus rhamnosus]
MFVNHAAYRLAVVDQSANDTKSAIETGFVSMADLSLICLPSKNRPKTALLNDTQLHALD